MDVFLRRATARCPSSVGMGLRCCMGDWQPLDSRGKDLRFFPPAPGAPGWSQVLLRPGRDSLGGSRMDTQTWAQLAQSKAVPSAQSPSVPSAVPRHL